MHYNRIQKFINDIKCICSIVVYTDPDCYQLVFVSGVIYSTTTLKYNLTSTTTDESKYNITSTTTDESDYR